MKMVFKRGKLNGAYTAYYKDGSIKRTGEYIDGMYNGKWELWAENGKKLYEIYYINFSIYRSSIL